MRNIYLSLKKRLKNIKIEYIYLFHINRMRKNINKKNFLTLELSAKKNILIINNNKIKHNSNNRSKKWIYKIKNNSIKWIKLF